mmetsp:Transcript_56123/g.132670  ORF Transcript_56123/g.132670 Transcript_56123/m.132670 type:complete len:206 (+) Transcript_56123:77-694(+)
MVVKTVVVWSKRSFLTSGHNGHSAASSGSFSGLSSTAHSTSASSFGFAGSSEPFLSDAPFLSPRSFLGSLPWRSRSAFLTAFSTTGSLSMTVWSSAGSYFRNSALCILMGMPDSTSTLLPIVSVAIGVITIVGGSGSASSPSPSSPSSFESDDEALASPGVWGLGFGVGARDPGVFTRPPGSCASSASSDFSGSGGGGTYSSFSW